MATPSLADSEFLMGYCGGCGKDVLSHIDFGPGAEEIRRCVHCDAPLTEEGLRPVRSAELDGNGYSLIEARTCGNGGGCGATGCGLRHDR